MILWCPFAVSLPVPGHEDGSGAFTGGQPKILHHTTEGSSFDGAFATYRVTGNLPHFTDSIEGGHYQVWQHLPLDVAASALEHPKLSAETNRDNVIQIEHVGSAATSAHWLGAYLDGIAGLCRWIEKQTGCERACDVSFAPGAPRMVWQAWHAYSGHLGHMHAPFNHHTDPGAVNIGRILGSPPSVGRPPTSTPYPEDKMRCITVNERGLDDAGHGFTDLFDVGAGTVISAQVNTAGYGPVPTCAGDQDQDGHARLQWVGPPNAPAFEARVWVAV